MVGNTPTPRTPANGPLVAWVFAKVGGQSHRFLSVDDRGRFTVRLDRLAVLVAEIITEHMAELDEDFRAGGESRA
jgi:hypothetical protein